MRLISYRDTGLRGDALGVVAGDCCFGVAAIISYCSQSFSLEPGDVIATGTPGGVGIFRDPPLLLTDGDEVTVEIERIGRLRNVCRTERVAVASA